MSMLQSIIISFPWLKFFCVKMMKETQDLNIGDCANSTCVHKISVSESRLQLLYSRKKDSQKSTYHIVSYEVWGVVRSQLYDPTILSIVSVYSSWANNCSDHYMLRISRKFLINNYNVSRYFSFSRWRVEFFLGGQSPVKHGLFAALCERSWIYSWSFSCIIYIITEYEHCRTHIIQEFGNKGIPPFTKIHDGHIY